MSEWEGGTWPWRAVPFLYPVRVAPSQELNTEIDPTSSQWSWKSPFRILTWLLRWCLIQWELVGDQYFSTFNFGTPRDQLFVLRWCKTAPSSAVYHYEYPWTKLSNGSINLCALIIFNKSVLSHNIADSLVFRICFHVVRNYRNARSISLLLILWQGHSSTDEKVYLIHVGFYHVLLSSSSVEIGQEAQII